MNKLAVFLERLYLRLLTWLIGKRTVIVNAKIWGGAVTSERILVTDCSFGAVIPTDQQMALSIPANSVGIVARNKFVATSEPFD